MLISNHSTFLICLLLIFYPALLNCFKLSEPRLLLSYNKGLSSNYTLNIIDSDENECFEWRSSHPNIVSVTPLFTDNDCSKSAILSSIANLPHREVTDILVYERTTNKKLHCLVYTDTVESIELNSLTDEIFLGDPPEKISIIARDKKGHIFSSISGLEVKYEVKNFNENFEPYGSDVIKLARFDISDYESPGESFELETRGLFSFTVLAVGRAVGRAVITATVLFHGSPVLQTKKLQLKVLPNVKLRPNSTLYLIRHAKVNVTLEKFRSEDDNLEFTADVEDTSVADFSTSSELHAKEYGSTSIKIHNQGEDIESKLDVQVVKIARIGFRISNGNYTILEELQIFEFFIDLFDEEGNMIHASDNLRLDVKFPPKLFHILHTTDNGTYFIVQTIAPGRSKVRAEFKGVLSEDSIKEKNSNVSSTVTVTVCQRLLIFPPYTLLPVVKERPMHKITLKVYGGTGKYIWSLSNYEVAKILTTTEENTIEVHVYEEIYDLTVTVTDLGNINLITKAQISIQTPNDLEAYPSVVEAEVNNFIIVPVALLGYEDRKKDIIRKFDDCSMLNQIDIIDPFVISYEKEADIPAFGKGCKSLQFKCRAPGHSRVNIEYTLDGSKNISYRTTVVLACFKELKPVYPVRVSVLALGTTQDVAFDGGPRRWILFKEGHFTELIPSNPEIVKINLIKDPVRYNKDLSVFRVKCLALGETILSFKIGNNPSATLPHPAKVEASIKLICSEPHSIHLKLFRKKTKKKLDENIVKVPFYGEKTFELDLYAKDKIGRRFANISSFRIAWDTDDKALATAQSAFDFESFENAVSGYRKLTRNFMTFKMRGGSGPLRVEAKLTSYRKDILEKEGIENYKELDEISTSIDLKLVSLRDLNSDLYDAAKENKDSEEYCESDSCIS